MKESFVHSGFKLNGFSFQSKADLLLYTKTNLKDIYTFLLNWFDKTNSIEVLTSGSTGKPKIIPLKKEHMVHSAIATGSFFNLGENTTALMCLQVQFIAGKMMLVRAMTLGWDLEVVKPSSNPLINIKKKYDFSAMAPLQLYNSIKKIDLLNKLIIGGGVISKELKDKINSHSTSMYQTYGMTETCTHIAVKPLNISAGLTNENNYYHCLKNIKVSKDERGCLLIDAPEILDKKLITNDIIHLLSNTTFKWMGRDDHIINSGGIKLIPEQIERKLASLINQRFFVYGKQDKILGYKLVLLVEGNRQDILLKKVMDFQENYPEKLHKYEVPKEIYFLKKFIETETKKIKRSETFEIINS